MKIRWVGNVVTLPEKTASNIVHSRSRKLPYISDADRPALAAVGGGPSVIDHLRELQEWPGDIWVSGSAYPWSRENGIDGTFFSIDQSPQMGKACANAGRAVVATCCDPSVFEALKNAEVEVFDIQHEGSDANHGATSITAVPKIALLMGYSEVHFFGCDSSFTEVSHAYYDEAQQYQMIVACDGKEYETSAAMLMQAEFMSIVIRACPKVFKNRSDGLLRAMTEAAGELDYEITHGDEDLSRAVKGITEAIC